MALGLTEAIIWPVEKSTVNESPGSSNHVRRRAEALRRALLFAIADPEGSRQTDNIPGDPEELNSLFKQAFRDRVYPRVYDAIMESGHGAQVPKFVHERAWTLAARMRYANESLHRIDELAADLGINVLLLKGAGVASWYPGWYRRYCWDIDLCVPGEREFWKFSQQLQANGYETPYPGVFAESGGHRFLIRKHFRQVPGTEVPTSIELCTPGMQTGWTTAINLGPAMRGAGTLRRKGRRKRPPRSGQCRPGD